MASTSQVPELPDGEVALIFKINDTSFNRCIILGMMHGIYTCIFLQTVWIVCVSRREKNQNRIGRKIMLAVVVALYFLGTITTAVNWAFTRYSFITHGENFWTIYTAFYNVSPAKQKPSTLFMVENVATGVTGGLQSILADIAMIWRCWTVWGSRWSIVVVPILSMIAGFIAKVFQEYISIRSLLNATDPEEFKPTTVDWTLTYLSLSLTVTLLCTILIVVRIVTVGRANRDTALDGYRLIIELIIESAALLSVILIIYMATYARGAYASIYVDVIAASIRGIAPTLLVGRVASGHSRPDDAWKGSVLSSLHFGTRNHTQTQASTQYSNQRDTTYGFEDGTPDGSLGESKPAAEGV
ncbi:hypothetical protein ARMGADRAFT_1077889 [Armillaria gallica]|uniref:Uncharacterized protein n=1 Tax=Armillaria gallica TaxID=47427 RepID=A0A2H3E1B3_ARMGA|nr:hypothetical protein ARMGADRAFT_1077889 [Armillaria gallica]